MSHQVTVICRHNQARSVLAAAALRRFFPDIEVVSAGISGVNGQRIPQSILDLAEAWGLEVVDVVSRSLEAIEMQLVKSDFVVVAEDEFIPHVADFGVSRQKIFSMQDKRFDHTSIPFDPIGQRDQVLSVELAKAIMTTTQLIRAEQGFKFGFPVHAVMTSSEADLIHKLKSAWSSVADLNGVIIVADFRAPNFQAVSQVCGKVIALKVNRIDQTLSFSEGAEDWELERVASFQGPLVISGRFEIDQVERFVLSNQFLRLISSLAKSRPTTIVAEPLGMGPIPYLLAANGQI